MSTKTTIANLALDAIGFNTIADIDDTNNRAAIVCKRQYDIVKRTILEEQDWRFAEKRVALSLVLTTTYDPSDTTDYTYAYEWPSDCLVAIEIYPSSSGSTKIPFTLQSNSALNETYILTNTQNAILVYTAATDSFTQMKSALFQTAFAYRLAAAIAMPLTKDDNKVDANFNRYFAILAQAKNKDANEGTLDTKRTGYKDAMKT